VVMTNQPQRRSSRNMSRRERRTAGVVRPAASVAGTPRPAIAPRRTFISEPAPLDYTTEYRFIRKDLVRILIWATILIAAMAALSFLPITELLVGS
jgi:hypothetical protein